MHAVLIVDDESAVRALSARWLESAGYTVRAASSSDEALAVLAGAPVGVAVCDVQMPGRNGIWLAGQIRQTSPETAVIMATGGHDLESAIACLRLGVRDYLPKPFGRERLLEAVGSAMQAYDRAVECCSRRTKALEVLRPLLENAAGQLEPHVLEALSVLCGPSESKSA
jgi:DNA-binding NtrC family response regulator